MSSNKERLNKIRSFLRIQSSPVTLTEIHEALTKRLNLKVSRKTIERDITALVEDNVITAHVGVPSRYVLNKPLEFELFLKVEEIQLILGLMDPETDLSIRLKKLLPT